MTKRSELEVVRTTQITGDSPAPRARTPVAAWMAGAALLALAAASAFAVQKQLQGLTQELDGKSLERAAALLDRTIEQQKADLLAEVSVLSEDTRVRTTVMTPEFNEATVRDVLEDLRRASGAAVMAVLDVRGKVQAVTGSESLRGMDLGASPLIAQALDRAATHVWTFPEEVLVVGLAPVRSGGQVAAIFLTGYHLGEQTLAPIERVLGVAGAVVIRDRVAATSSRSPDTAAAVAAAASLSEGQPHLVKPGDTPYLARITRTSQSAGAGRVVWVVPTNSHGQRLMKLQILGWMPILLVGLALALAISLSRRRTDA